MARITINDLSPGFTLSHDDLRKISGGSIISVYGGTGSMIAFPDICQTPSPGGPIPVPYPNFRMSSGSSEGASKVKFGEGTVTTKSGSYSLSSGDEPGSE